MVASVDLFSKNRITFVATLSYARANCESGYLRQTGVPLSLHCITSFSMGTRASMSTASSCVYFSTRLSANSILLSHLSHTTWLIFSTKPIKGTRSVRYISAPFLVMSRAAACGELTSTTPSTGTCWLRDRWTSPVPGGVSTTSTSSGPHTAPLSSR